MSAWLVKGATENYGNPMIAPMPVKAAMKHNDESVKGIMNHLFHKIYSTYGTIWDIYLLQHNRKSAMYSRFDLYETSIY